jgi:hypothetical protein
MQNATGGGRAGACDPSGRGVTSLPMDAAEHAVDERFRELLERYRDRCLWFERRDFVPSTLEERLRVLDSIQRHGDLQAFRDAGELRQWLLRSSSATSAG